jgi:hypothetical protein
MSFERRAQLDEEIALEQPSVSPFIRPASSSLISGSWEFLSYSFERGFETMWDQAQRDGGGLLIHPLLMLWRQSVELAIKSAIYQLSGGPPANLSHNLTKMFERLLAARLELGWNDDDNYTQKVINTVAYVQSFDPFADRFRYPTDRTGQSYEGVHVDLDELYKSHFIITTWCWGAELEYEARYIL